MCDLRCESEFGSSESVEPKKIARNSDSRGTAKISMKQWKVAQDQMQEVSIGEQEYAERFQAEAARLQEEVQEIRKRGQDEVEWEFRKRLLDMQHWRKELMKNFNDINAELDALKVYKKRVQDAMGSLCPIIEVNNEIMAIRECRIGTERVLDPAFVQMQQEIKIVRGVQSVLQRSLEHIDEQIRLLRKCISNLGGELKDKDAALSIDEQAFALHEHRLEVKRRCEPGANELASNATEHEWIQSTVNLKVDAEKTINAGIHLRTTIDSMLRQMAEDLQREIQKTDSSLQLRLKHIVDAKIALEEEHSRIAAKIREVEESTCSLKKAFEDKQAAIALSETRLGLRGQRPNLELIRDSVQLRLLREIEDNNASMAKLNSKILQAQNVVRSLIRNQLEIEEDIIAKANSIGIEEIQLNSYRIMKEHNYCEEQKASQQKINDCWIQPKKPKYYSLLKQYIYDIRYLLSHTPEDTWNACYLGEMFYEECHPSNEIFFKGALGGTITGAFTGYFSPSRIPPPMTTIIPVSLKLDRANAFLIRLVTFSSLGWKIFKRGALASLLYTVLQCDLKPVKCKDDEWKPRAAAASLCGLIFGARAGFKGMLLGSMMLPMMEIRSILHHQNKKHY